MLTVISSHIHWPVVEKLKYLSANGEAVQEGDAAAGWMAPVRQIAGFKQGSAHQADLGNFAAHAVDLNPIADANAILAHEDEPAEKREDEILHGDGESGGGKAKNGGHLPAASRR